MKTCPQCHFRAPFHRPNCALLLRPLIEKQQERDALPGRDARESYEVTERSRFEEKP